MRGTVARARVEAEVLDGFLRSGRRSATMVPHDVAARIQQLIRSGDLKAGERLPSQRLLSSRWGISRASLREALSVLETLGLVDIRPGLGVYVRETPGTASHRNLTEAGVEPRAVYEARLALETSAAALAARVRDDLDLATLAESVIQLETALEAGDVVAMARADSLFHGALIETARNPLIAAMYLLARDAMEATQRAPMASRLSLSEMVHEHRAILEAIRGRMPEAAAQAMRDHLAGSARRLGIVLDDS